MAGKAPAKATSSPCAPLSEVFRAKFRDGLKALYDQGALEFHGANAHLADPRQFSLLLAQALAKPWNVYSKSLRGARGGSAYLSRYTHRVAIGNGRIRALDEQGKRVAFSYKDYADHARSKTMKLDLGEFLRRFYCTSCLKRFVQNPPLRTAGQPQAGGEDRTRQGIDRGRIDASLRTGAGSPRG